MTTMRQKVLAGLGANRCAWCGSTHNLELDHVHGGGNQHRAQIGVKLETWLVREHQRTGVWPAGLIQVLCRRCHDRKSGRRPMPPAKGKISINVALPSDLIAPLEHAAAQFEGSKSKVVEAALRGMVDGTAQPGALDGLQQQLSVHTADVTTALQGVQTTLAQLSQAVQALASRLDALETRLDRQHTDLQDAYVSLKEARSKGGFLGALRR